ncbi:MAG: hypothetical protein N2578_06940 [Bdellovibrionaceae bacterium]|nr:hypothetical protein [Pseudobdellovibrionaceae bacterium]
MKDPTKIPGKNLRHYVLGPMNDRGLEETRKLEADIWEFGGRSKVNLIGTKYYLATVLRAKIYGDENRVGFELRQFNYDYNGLLSEVSRLTTVLEKGANSRFATFDRKMQIYTFQKFLA